MLFSEMTISIRKTFSKPNFKEVDIIFLFKKFCLLKNRVGTLHSKNELNKVVEKLY